MNILNHVCFIPDGNRRQALRDGISLAEVYRRGAQKAVEATQWCKAIGVRHVSFFGVSIQNMIERSDDEMIPLRQGVLLFCRTIGEMPGMTLHIVGDQRYFDGWAERDELLQLKEQGGWKGDFVVHAAFNYSGEAGFELPPLIDAIKVVGYDRVEQNPRGYILSAGVPDIDLLIRTGGRDRLSGCFPFQTSSTELRFIKNKQAPDDPTKVIHWGDFTKEMFDEAVRWFREQVRTKGA